MGGMVVLFDLLDINLMKAIVLLALVCLAAAQPQVTAPKFVPPMDAAEPKPATAAVPQATSPSTPPSQPAITTHPVITTLPSTPLPTIAKEIPVKPTEATPTPPVPQQSSVKVTESSLQKVPENSPAQAVPPSPPVTQSPQPVSPEKTEGKTQTPPKQPTPVLPLTDPEAITQKTALPKEAVKEPSVKPVVEPQTGPIPGPIPETVSKTIPKTETTPKTVSETIPEKNSETISTPTQPIAGVSSQEKTPATVKEQSLSQAVQAATPQSQSAKPTQAVLSPKPQTEGSPKQQPVVAVPTTPTPTPASEKPAPAKPEVLETKASLLTTVPQSIESQRVPPTAAQTAIVSPKDQTHQSSHLPSQTSSPTVTRPQPPKKQLSKPTSLSLESILPSPASTKAIQNCLIGILLVFAVIQLLGLLCRKKKRYTEKFQEYSQRSEVEEMEGME